MKTPSLLAVLVLLVPFLVLAVSLVGAPGPGQQEDVSLQAALEHTGRAVALASRSDEGWIGTEQTYRAYTRLLRALGRTEAAAEPPPPRADPPVTGKAVAPGGEASVAVVMDSPIGSTFVIRNDPGVAEVEPAVAYNPARWEFLVVWFNDRPDYPDIQAQRLKWDGTPIGGPFYIATGAVQRRHPAVAYNSIRDEYLVVWEHKEGSGTLTSIRGRVVSALGEVLGASDIIISHGPELKSCFSPAVVYGATHDRYLVVWERSVSGSVSADIEGQLIYGSALEGDNILIATGSWNYDHGNPAVAYNPRTNEFLVAWEREDKHDDIYDICARRMSSAGALQGPELVLIYVTVSNTQPAVAALPEVSPNGRYLVVWELHNDTGNRDIYGREVAGDGTPLSQFYISWAASDETRPAVAAYDYSERSLVTWKRAADPPYLWTYIHGRNVPTGGSPLGPESYLGGVQAGRPAVTEGLPGDFLVVYDDQPLLGDRGIYGRLWGNRIYLPLVVRNAPGP